MSYTYNEPSERQYEPLPEGDYDFTVQAVKPTYTNDRGTFILPVEIQLLGTDRKIQQWLSAGISSKGDSFDMIAPFLKSIKRNPAVGDEPDFSSRNLLGANGKAHVREMPYTGNNEKYKGMTFPGVAWWIYEKDSTSQKLAKQAAARTSIDDEEDDIPF